MISGSFPIDHCFFARRSPTVSACVAGFSDNPVAGYQTGHRIGPHRGADGPGCSGLTDAPGNVFIRADAARWDAKQSLPDFDLKVRSIYQQVDRLRAIGFRENAIYQLADEFGVLF